MQRMLLLKNTNRKPKKLWTDNQVGSKISYYRAATEKDEAYFVAKKFVTIFKWGNENILILQCYIVRMLSLVWSRRFSLNLTFRTKLSGYEVLRP